MKKIVAMNLWTMLFLASVAHADIYFRNLTADPIQTYYAVFDDNKKPVTEYAFTSNDLGDVDKSSIDDVERELTLGEALSRGINHFTYVEMAYKDGVKGDALFAYPVPEPLIYQATDNLIISIIDKADEKKYNVRCRTNPCAIVRKIS